MTDRPATSDWVDDIPWPTEEPGTHTPDPTSNGQHPATLVDKLKERLLTADQLIDLPPPSWLIDDIIETATLAVLYGKPGCGKSFVALDWALCIALGVPWQNWKTRQGRVLYIAAEGIAGLGQRVRAWQESFRVKTIPDIWFCPGALNLLDPERRQALTDLTKNLHPSLVVIDTMARSMVGGDENSARDVGLVIDAASAIVQATQATVLLVHHTAKDGGAYRGSSALEGGVETMIECAAEGTSITLSNEKAKNSQQFRDIKLIRDQIDLGEGLSSCVVRLEGPNRQADRLEGGRKVIHSLLADTYQTTGASTPALIEASGLSRPYVYEIVNALAKDGLIQNIGTEQRAHWKVDHV